MKKIENRLIFDEVMGKSLVSCFFDSQCICTPSMSMGQTTRRTDSNFADYPFSFWVD